MANWCNNILSFKGKKEDVKKVMQLFYSLQQKQEELKEGVLPEGIPKSDYRNRYFFDIYAEVESISFESKWVPPVEELQWISDKYHVEIEDWVDEVGNEIYGRIIFTPNEPELIEYLIDEDFKSFKYLEGENCYLFEGEKYSVEEEIKEILWERRYNN